MYETEMESGCQKGELEGTFPANIVTQEYDDGQNDEYTTQTLQEFFEVLGFQAPYCVVRRKYDGKKGSLEFSHAPRLYWGFQSSEDY